MFAFDSLVKLSHIPKLLRLAHQPWKLHVPKTAVCIVQIWLEKINTTLLTEETTSFWKSLRVPFQEQMAVRPDDSRRRLKSIIEVAPSCPSIQSARSYSFSFTREGARDLTFRTIPSFQRKNIYYRDWEGIISRKTSCEHLHCINQHPVCFGIVGTLERFQEYLPIRIHGALVSFSRPVAESRAD